uniref:Uncharacterized protein n=1 Tax=Romanomermis culicivorax TaxID=13658 RepID=A0A915HUN5_ROMCU
MNNESLTNFGSPWWHPVKDGLQQGLGKMEHATLNQELWKNVPNSRMGGYFEIHTNQQSQPDSIPSCPSKRTMLNNTVRRNLAITIRNGKAHGQYCEANGPATIASSAKFDAACTAVSTSPECQQPPVESTSSEVLLPWRLYA